MKKIKKYDISGVTLDPSLIVDSSLGNFEKYSKNNKSTTWVFLQDNEMKFLQQFNQDIFKYCGFLTEPYLLFLDHANKLSVQADSIKKNLKNCIVDKFNLKDDFILSLINQDIFDQYLIVKINFIVFATIAIESYLNNIIPDDLIVNGSNKQDIELKYSIKQKLAQVIPTFKNINNVKEYQQKYSEVFRLAELRNNFVHLKTNNSGMRDSYIRDFEVILKLEAKKEFLQIQGFINYVDSLSFINLTPS